MPPDRKTSELVRVRAVVQGMVQGVSYRWYAQRRAAELGVSGFVRNLPDGSVEVVGEGNRGSLDSWLDALRAGPSGAIVEAVDAEWDTPTGEFSRFEIRY